MAEEKVHTDQNTYLGELNRPVQVNFTAGQKALLIRNAIRAGVPLSVFIRMGALAQAGAMLAVAQEAQHALTNPQNLGVTRKAKREAHQSVAPPERAPQGARRKS